MKRAILVGVILMMLSLTGFAQKNTAKTKKTITPQVTSASLKQEVKDTISLKNSLKIITSIKEESVKLRWALTSPIGWKACNEYGFRVERYTLKKDTSWLPTPELIVIADPYKARPVEEWENLAKQDDYAAIMAQALYGKDMQVDIADKNPLTQIVNETQDLQQRYTLSMLACDMSFEAAKLAAWGYEDKTVKKNERYFYRIIPLAPSDRVQVDSAFVVVKMEDYKKLPAPGKPDVLFSDSLATIGYNYFFLKETYLAFHIERSMDGKIYEQITRTPVTAMNIKKGQESYQFYFSDKLKDNSTTYYYRIKGVTSFSEVGPVSIVVKGKGISKNNVFPHLTSCLLNAKDQAEIEWEFDPVNESRIKGFEISHSQRNEGPYLVVQTITDVKARTALVKKLENSNYFTITALGKNGEKNVSSKRFLQLNDSIPPAPPEVISARVDSSGKVRVEWKANTEKDFRAYKVFRANNLKEEPAILTDTMYYQTVFEDQLNGSMINRKIYYYIIAIDKRYNESQFSKPAEAVRPDVTPPTSPIFKSYTVSDKGVFLQWAGCRDEDVARHILLRKEVTKNAVWVSVAQFNDTTSSYLDQTAEAGRTYFYSIIAKDNSGLESLAMKSLKLSLPSDPAVVKVASFKAIPNLDGNQIDLQWQTDRTDIDHFDLYKGEEEEPVTLWKVLDSKQRSINDNIKLNHKYNYMIRIVLKSGSTGVFSKINL